MWRISWPISKEDWRVADKLFVLQAERQQTVPWRDRLSTNRLHRFLVNRFVTEGGDALVNLRVAYRVFGKPSHKMDNLVLVYHALTGDANCAGYDATDGRVQGWWEPLFKHGAALDISRWCVICPNHPSSCYGSSGPLDRTIDNTEQLGLRFPSFSPRDLVSVYRRLLEYLGVRRLALVVGGSLGGMLALETAVMLPDLAERVAVIAAPAESSAQSVAFNHIQRRCFDLDRNFKGGAYYGGPQPILALSLARQIAMITYRSPAEMQARFGRALKEQPESEQRHFEVESYLDYQGEKLIRRFDPNSYIKLLKILDAHDIGRNRDGIKSAVGGIRARLLLVGIDTDILYPPEEVRAVYDIALEAGCSAEYRILKTIHGHDGFLIEIEQIDEMLREFCSPTGESPDCG
jgi:homoserine O-acetyltransferase